MNESSSLGERYFLLMKRSDTDEKVELIDFWIGNARQVLKWYRLCNTLTSI